MQQEKLHICLQKLRECGNLLRVGRATLERLPGTPHLQAANLGPSEVDHHDRQEPVVCGASPARRLRCEKAKFPACERRASDTGGSHSACERAQPRIDADGRARSQNDRRRPRQVADALKTSLESNHSGRSIKKRVARFSNLPARQ